jgi:CBS domain-containing protein
MDIRKSLDSPLSSYISKDFVKVSTTESVAGAARAMMKAGTGEAIVLKDGKPIGIVTEKDILYKVVAVGKDPSRTDVSVVMSSPVENIGGDVKVEDAIAKMSKLGVRRLLVMKNEKLEGIVTQKRIVSGQENVELPELGSPTGITCPYCGAVLRDAEELSKHMDQLHVGEGLLKGDRRKW